MNKEKKVQVKKVSEVNLKSTNWLRMGHSASRKMLPSQEPATKKGMSL
jgi:hypothetical protein